MRARGFDITDTAGEVRVQRTTSNEKRIFCMFRLEGYAPRDTVRGWTRPQAPIRAIKTRELDGACSLLVTGSDGKVWTNFWPKGDSPDWSGWFPIADNTFPLSG